MNFVRFVSVVVAVAAVAPAVSARAATTAGTDGRRAEITADIKALESDIQALKAAHERHDKAAVKSDLVKLKTDWQALPAGVRERIEEKHPALAKRLHEQLAPKTTGTTPKV